MKHKRKRDDPPIRPLNFQSKNEITDFVFGFQFAGCNTVANAIGPPVTTPPDATGVHVPPPNWPPPQCSNAFQAQPDPGPTIGTNPTPPGGYNPPLPCTNPVNTGLYDPGDCAGGMANPHEPEEPGISVPPPAVNPLPPWSGGE